MRVAIRAAWPQSGRLQILIVLAFDKRVDDALMARLTGRGQIAKVNFAPGIGVRVNADVRFSFVACGRITTVTFFARHTNLFVRGRMPLKIAIAQRHWLADLGVTSHAIIGAIIRLQLLRGNG